MGHLLPSTPHLATWGAPEAPGLTLLRVVTRAAVITRVRLRDAAIIIAAVLTAALPLPLLACLAGVGGTSGWVDQVRGWGLEKAVGEGEEPSRAGQGQRGGAYEIKGWGQVQRGRAWMEGVGPSKSRGAFKWEVESWGQELERRGGAKHITEVVLSLKGQGYLKGSGPGWG